MKIKQYLDTLSVKTQGNLFSHKYCF